MIRIIDVSKKFRIWEDRSRDLKETAINLLRGKKRSFRELWALRGIDLEIEEGETVAFIGENGSGKSTLLKLLAGIYAPDEGKIISRGKISTLLELGVGFHPDLTGEENIYLNGAMLGFDRGEMREKFDEIVAFSEIGNFVYSPIRTYSSGMLMRLGFSIATCVDPDILLVDEILAVGDEAFQQKSLRRMEEFKSEGKTIVIVSHALELVRKFCDRTILLHQGRLITDGSSEKTIDQYLTMLSVQGRVKELEDDRERTPIQTVWEKEAMEGQEKPEKREEDRGRDDEIETFRVEKPAYQHYGTLEAEITGVALSNEKGEETDIFDSGEQVSIRFKIRFHDDVDEPIVGFYLRKLGDGEMGEIYGINTFWKNIHTGFFKKGEEVEVGFSQRIPLPEGEYYITAAISRSDQREFYDCQENVKCFMVRNHEGQWVGAVNLDSVVTIQKPDRSF